MVFARDDDATMLLLLLFRLYKKNVFIRCVKMRVFVKCRFVQILPKSKS